MKLDCSTCELKDIACGDCVVTLLLSFPAPERVIDEVEEQALAVLAGAGLVPQLRLIASADTPSASIGGVIDVENPENKVG
ncbi:MAG: hypothetical protein RIS75_579 [Actinomycetota bacterium]|jgi:hypothetical protein